MTMNWTSAAHEIWCGCMTEFAPREVRYILVGDYEMRYEISANEDIWILRLWHTREFR